MRRGFAIALLVLLSACESGPGTNTRAVDPASLPPMSGREQALLAAAEGALRTGDRTSAIRDYQTAIAQSEGHIEAHISLARVYLAQGEAGNARPILEKAVVWQPNHPQANYLLGKILISENRPAEAEEHFARGLHIAPGNADLLNGSGIANDMLRNHARAQTLYLRAIALTPPAETGVMRTNLAMSYLLDGAPKKAVVQLEAEVKKPGASPVSKHNLALAYGMLGRNTEAKKLLGDEMTEADRQLALERLKRYIATTPAAEPGPVIPGGPKGGRR